jgi:6-hydroxytryprostatin B O-methyltransferase
MGGSIGHVSVEIASQHPNLTIIDQDFACLEPQFNDFVPANLKSRILFQTHDFFTHQTVKADVYLLKHILHDWPDVLCMTIIRNIVPAMKNGSRIVVMDGVMPEVGEAPNYSLKINATFDLQMMALFNAKERTKRDWEALFKGADPRLNIKAFRQPLGSAASLIEVVFEG